MKSYWWQGGVHIEPESAEDLEILCKFTEFLDVVQVGHSFESSPIGTVETGDQKSVI